MNTLLISGYKFIPLQKIATLRVDLRKQCIDLEIKGTILLSIEGININLAGSQNAIAKFKQFLQQDPRFADIIFKEGYSNVAPFSRMLIKLKKEIVTMGVADVKSPTQPQHAITPQQLKQWLDQGEAVTLLDTRNDYEYKIGTFENAKLLDIKNFREFPDLMKNYPEAEKEKPIIMFCTGGIRCEKAMPFLEEQGFKKLYQLHGGILQYFADCGSAHWQGECFVFDDRIAVDPKLQVTGTQLCQSCQMPVTLDEQRKINFAESNRCEPCQLEK